MFKIDSLKFYVVVAVFIGAVPFSNGHLGHDHSEEDHSKRDENWINSRNISLTTLTGVELIWVDTDPEWMIMKMSSRTSGYVSVGFCPRWKGTMQECDIVIGWVDTANNSAVELYDYWSFRNEHPTRDDVQNYELIKGEETNGYTTIEFRRKWNTEDINQDANLEHNSVHIIYAWHPSDPTDPDTIPPHDHNTRGHTTKAIYMRNPAVKDNGESNEPSAGDSIQLNLPSVLLISVATVMASVSL